MIGVPLTFLSSYAFIKKFDTVLLSASFKQYMFKFFIVRKVVNVLVGE